MIKTFRHRGLKELYEHGQSAKLPPGHIPKLLRILTALDQCSSPAGMNLPGFRLHPLKGRMKDQFAVSVSANWRVTFRFEAGHAADVNYVDYH